MLDKKLFPRINLLQKSAEHLKIRISYKSKFFNAPSIYEYRAKASQVRTPHP
jgi:hypothetical protein